MSSRFDQAMVARLQRLEAFPTLSPFSKGFYRFIQEQFSRCDETADPLRRAYILLLRVETRRHGGVADAVTEGVLNVFSLLRTSRDIRTQVTRLLRLLGGIKCSRPEEEAIWQLLVAECYYHLGESPLVIASLRHALDRGCDHPLIHFALGYNLYTHGVREYTQIDPKKRQVIPTDPAKFAESVRQASQAFHSGLTGGPFDAQLFWWIGFMAEILDEKDEAETAYRAAADADPGTFGEVVEQRLARLRKEAGAAPPGEDPASSDAPPPITDDEIAEAKRLLNDLDRFPDFFIADAES